MDTPRERAFSFLHRQAGWVERFGSSDDPEWLAQRDGRVAGAIGALRAAGLLTAGEAAEWEARLLSPESEGPQAPEDVVVQADAVLEELLQVVPTDYDGLDPNLSRFEGALHALGQVGAARAEWDERFRRRTGRPSAEQELEEMRELNAGGTEVELVAVLPGPDETVDGVRLLYALRFADGISFVLSVEDDVDDWWDRELELRDDVGTTYWAGGGGGGGQLRNESFRTAPPEDAKWVELTGITERPIRVSL